MHNRERELATEITDPHLDPFAYQIQMSLIPVVAINRMVLTFHYVKPKSGIHQHTTKRVTSHYRLDNVSLRQFWYPSADYQDNGSKTK